MTAVRLFTSWQTSTSLAGSDLGDAFGNLTVKPANGEGSAPSAVGVQS